MLAKIAQFLFDMLLPLILGYVIRRKTKIPPKVFDILVTINITFVLSLLSMFSLWGMKLSSSYIWLPILGAFQQLIPGFVGFLIGAKRLKDPGEKGSFVTTALTANRTIMGTLSVFILLGEKAYALSQLVVIFEPLISFTVAFPYAQYCQAQLRGEIGERFRLIRLFNRNMTPLLAITLGLLLNISGLSRPVWAGVIFPYLIHLNGWTALLPVGYTINFSGIKKRLKVVWSLVGLKFLIAPFATLILIIPFYHEPLIVKVLMILAFAPSAIFSVLTSKIFQLDVDLTVTVFIITTAIYLGFGFPVLAVALHFLH